LNIQNVWNASVDDRTIDLLEAWIERRIRNGSARTAYLPSEVERWEVKKRYNKKGMALFDFIYRSGLDFSRSTRPKESDNVEVFGVDCFLELPEEDRIIILAHADPFGEFDNIHDESWINFLKSMDISNNGKYQKRLEESMMRLQKKCEDCHLSKQIFNNDILETWAAIASFMRRSIPTVIRMHKEEGLPVAIIGGVATSRKSILEDYVNHKFEKFSDKGDNGEINLKENVC